ncbi:MAG: hypothetical protein ABJA67_15550 [Chthonomonadales bacterium]
MKLKGAMRVASGTIWDVRAQLEENFDGVKALLDQAATNTDVRVQIAAATEIRHHLELANRMLATLGEVESVIAFQEMVIDLLGRISKKERDRFVEAWKAAGPRFGIREAPADPE